MATLDQLTAEQRAIIELVLQRGKSYEELAEMLGMADSRVQELARAALVTLSPVSAESVDEEWRGGLADYVLGQQSGPESTATRGHLRRSEQARTWTRSLLDSLDRLYQNDLPTIPDAGGGGREHAQRPAREERPERASLSPEAEEAVRQRRLVGGAGAAGVAVLLIVLVWPIGLLTGGDDKGSSSSGKTQSAAQQTSVVGQVEMKPVGGAKGQGAAVVASRGGQLQLVVQAQLTATKAKEAYEVWLYNSQGDAKSLGAQVTDQQGSLQGAAPLPTNYKRYKFIDVSLEKVDNNAKHSGSSVLRAPFSGLQKPPEGGAGAVPQGGQGGGTAAPQQQAPQQQAPQGGQTPAP